MAHLLKQRAGHPGRYAHSGVPRGHRQRQGRRSGIRSCWLRLRQFDQYGYGSKFKPPGDRRFESMFPFTMVPFWVPIFDPQPYCVPENGFKGYVLVESVRCVEPLIGKPTLDEQAHFLTSTSSPETAHLAHQQNQWQNIAEPSAYQPEMNHVLFVFLRPKPNGSNFIARAYSVP